MRLRTLSSISCVSFALGLGFTVAGCSEKPQPAAVLADSRHGMENGKALMRSYGCVTCHQIPSVIGAIGTVGPSLDHVGTKYYLAGQLENNDENLALWIQHPHSVNPKTLMPEMNVRDDDARDMVLYLRTLR